MSSHEGYVMISDPGHAPGGVADQLRRRYLLLEADGLLHLHQSVRTKNAARPPLALLSLQGAEVRRAAETSVELKLSDRTLLVSTNGADEADAWEAAMRFVALPADASPPGRGSEAGETESYRVSTMETVEQVDLKLTRANRTASAETFDAADASRTDDERALLQMLWDAAARGDDDEEIDEVLDGLPEHERDGADVLGRSALFLAASAGHGATCERLLARGVSTERRSNSGATPLMIACEKGHAQAVSALLAGGAAVTSSSLQGGVTTSGGIAKYADGPAASLHLAVSSGSEAVVEALLASRTSRATDVVGDGCAGVLELDHTDRGGLTPLMLAANLGLDVIARRLLEAGASCDLHSAASLAVESAVRVADSVALNAPDPNGRTPIILAAAAGHASIVELAIARGAQLDAIDSFRTDALQAACAAGHTHIAKTLLAAAPAALLRRPSASLLRRPSGTTPLLSHSLLAHENADGETALLLASKHGFDPLVQLLLGAMDKDGSHGGEHAHRASAVGGGAFAWIDRCDTRGASPLLVAVAGGHEAVARSLIAARAKYTPPRLEFEPCVAFHMPVAAHFAASLTPLSCPVWQPRPRRPIRLLGALRCRRLWARLSPLFFARCECRRQPE